MLNLIDKIGNWNPQLFRELKGRLKPGSVAIALITSLGFQFIIFLCKYEELSDENNQIDVLLWEHWKWIYLSLSIIFIFTLLVASTYLIVNDLSQEERQGTLNFIRLSPQSEISIFTGKMLGVPVLIHLIVLAAIPFHIFAGIKANISLDYILFFYLILVASCILCYSLALLFAIFDNSAFNGRKAFLGSGCILFLLILSMSGVHFDLEYSNAWFKILSPIEMTNYLFLNFSYNSELINLQFFNLPLGKNVVSLLAFYLINYGLLTYWIWQGLKRCFRNPSATMLNKQQSYFLVANFNFIHLGFVISTNDTIHNPVWGRLIYLYIWNICFFMALFAMILPHRQAIVDWATFRYKKVSNSKVSSQKSLLPDLIFGEKSPATLAIAINLIIAASFFVIPIFNKDINTVKNGDQIVALLGILLFVSLTMIYATIAQIMLMLKNSKRTLWAVGATSASIILPVIILMILDISASNTGDVGSIFWLFTISFWHGIKNASYATVLSVFLCELTIVGLLNWYLVKQVTLAGESATKALFANSKS
ncbi:MAG: hypothetical protein AAF915_12520 [Cyanobacteria bacterium P01_D01_bin.50]